MNLNGLAAVAVVCMTFMGAAAVAAIACSSSPPTVQNAAQAADTTAFDAELTDCVTAATSRAQGQACIDATIQRWCGYGGPLQVQHGCGVDAGPEGGISIGPSLTKLLNRMLPADAGGQ